MFGISQRIAIDLGTTNTRVYVPKQGVVFDEPSVVATDIETNKIVAIGAEARDMLGRTPENIRASQPVHQGVIADYQAAKSMMKYYLGKVAGGFSLSRPDVMIAVPAGATSTERRAVIDAALSAGARATYLIKSPIAASLGAGIPIASAAGNMVVVIGGGSTDVAILSLGGLVAGNSVKVGGDQLNTAIADYIRKRYNLAIGTQTAEDIKRRVGSALPVGSDKTTEIRGRDVIAGLPKTVTIGVSELSLAMQEPLGDIVEAIRAVLEQTPPELSSDIIDRGMVLAGGGALLKNLDAMLTKITGVPCVVTEDAEHCVVKGIGIALENLEDYKRSLAGVQ